MPVETPVRAADAATALHVSWDRSRAIVNLRGDPDDTGLVDAVSAAVGLPLPTQAGGCPASTSRRIVWAGPDDWFVPAGRYAQDALAAAGLWQALESRVVGAASVRQALDYVARGEVDAGFVYATDAALMPERVRMAFVVPGTRTVLYPVAPVAASPSPALARRFAEYVAGSQARAVLARHGFGLP